MIRLEKFVAECVVVAALLTATSAQADPINFPSLGFNSGRPVSGSVTVSSGGTLATTTVAGTVQVISGGIIPPEGLDLSIPGDVDRANQFAVIGGQFSFATAAATHIESDRYLVFGPGGRFEMTGAIPQLGIPEPSLLLSGSFTAGASYQPVPQVSFFPLSGMAVTVHPVLSALFEGLPLNPMFFFSGNIRTAAGPATVTESFTLPVFSANLFVEPVAAPIPEPATLVLVGSGILVAGGRRLKRPFRTLPTCPPAA